MTAIPHRAYAIRDGETEPEWWLHIGDQLFTRWQGNRETVTANDLTWVAHGYADQVLYPMFGRKYLFTKDRM